MSIDSLIWNFEEDNFTFADSYVDCPTCEPVICMRYQYDPGWQVRWADLAVGGDRESAWIELNDTSWSELFSLGKEENLYWLTEKGVYLADQQAQRSGQKTYFVERKHIDLNDIVQDFNSSRWLYAKQLYFHLASQISMDDPSLNLFGIQIGWANTLMDDPDWLPVTYINLQTRQSGGKVKYDFRSTGRYLALRMYFNDTGPLRMTGAEIDVEQRHGR